MDGAKLREHLEDLVLLRDRHLSRFYRGEVNLNLERLYREAYADLVDFRTARQFRAREVAGPRAPLQGDAVQALRCLEWLVLEARTAAERQRIRQRYHDETRAPAPAPTIRTFHADPSREHARDLVRALDGANPDRLVWLRAWQATLQEYCDPPQDWLQHWQGWDLDLWRHQRDQALDLLLEQWRGLQHQLKMPEGGHWSQYWPPADIRDHLARQLLVPPARMIGDLWHGVLNLPDPPYLDYRWLEPVNGRTPPYPRAYFDGEHHCLHLTQRTSWWRPFEVLDLWGRLQPAGWTRTEYPWYRLYGGDPSVLLGWGLWLQRWPLRATFWTAIDREREYLQLATWLRWLDLLLILWPAVIWPWTLELAHVPVEQIGSWSQRRRQEMQELLGWTMEPEIFLAWTINRGWTFLVFRAWTLSEAVHTYLESFYGLRWWREKRARFLLTDLWEAGTDPAVEDLVKDLGMPLVPA